MKKIKYYINLIKRTYSLLKNPWWRARKNYITYYDTLPIDEKCILLESQHGTQFNGVIFHLCKFLSESEEYSDYQIVIPSWGRYMKKTKSILRAYGMNNVKVVMYVSDEYFKILASAKYLINDNTFDPAFIKKPGQIYLNTWHGTPLKTLGRKMHTDLSQIGNPQKNFAASDYILFPNALTRDAIMKDYMVEDIAELTEIYSGYPRNEVFLDDERDISSLRKKYAIQDKKVYAYMPTFRGSHVKGGTDKNDIYLKFYFYELDRKLQDDEILYVNLHPVARKNVTFGSYKHIREFPQNIETYDFLNLADCLVTDYSSVFFDYANTRRKIIMFTYDRDEYLKDRGMYIDIDTLPFTKVETVEELLVALRTPKDYDDEAFMKEYCAYECKDASKKLCDYVIKGENNGLITRRNTVSDKENVILHVGNLAANGITSSVRNLLKNLDLDKRNYYLSFRQNLAKPYEATLNTFPEQVKYFPFCGEMNITVKDQVIRKLFKEKIIKAEKYVSLQDTRLNQEWIRCYGSAKFDSAIQYNGYQDDVTLMYAMFQGNNVIYAHSDMEREMRTRGNVRKDVLTYAYTHFNSVAMVSEDIVEPNEKLVGQKLENVHVCNNMIDFTKVLELSQKKMDIKEPKKIFPSRDAGLERLNSESKKFITIGRYSPEKGHLRLLDAFKKIVEENNDVLLVIIGGNSYSNYYEKTIQHAKSLGIEKNVVFVFNTPNPYSIMKKCDYFVFSSFYEGFGIVLAEADIVGIPVISTDIVGPRRFMKKYGGTLVEDSTEGLESGMRRMLAGEIKPMNVDYAQYNAQAVSVFEGMLNH